MNSRPTLLPGLALIAACGTDPGPAEIAVPMSGAWVLTFPSLFVSSSGVQCASVSGTVLQVEQVGNRITAPVSQGLLMCGASTNGSIAVPFAPGRVTGTLDGDRLDVRFEGAVGHLTGTVQGSTASGSIEYVDASYDVTITGSWLAEHRTPSGAISVTISTASFSGQPLPSALLTLDGDAPVQAPQNGVMILAGLSGGRHLLTLATGAEQSCTITGGPGGALGGINPNAQFIDIVETDPPTAIVYHVSCA